MISIGLRFSVLLTLTLFRHGLSHRFVFIYFCTDVIIALQTNMNKKDNELWGSFSRYLRLKMRNNGRKNTLTSMLMRYFTNITPLKFLLHIYGPIGFCINSYSRDHAFSHRSKRKISLGYQIRFVSIKVHRNLCLVTFDVFAAKAQALDDT